MLNRVPTRSREGGPPALTSTKWGVPQLAPCPPLHLPSLGSVLCVGASPERLLPASSVQLTWVPHSDGEVRPLKISLSFLLL